MQQTNPMRCFYYLQQFTLFLLLIIRQVVVATPEGLRTIVGDSKTEEAADYYDADTLSCTAGNSSYDSNQEDLSTSSLQYCSNCNNHHEDCNNHVTGTDRMWKWDLDVIHECNIDRVNLIDVYRKFQKQEGNHGGLVPPLYSKPLIIHTTQGQKSYNGCLYSVFQEKTSLQNITSNLPEDFNVTLSSSNSYSAHRRTIPLVQYLNETISSETLPTHLSNETWYLFGETYSKDWQRLLSDFCLPPCQTCTKDLSALAFGIGGRGSGVQWHTHGPGFSQSIHGRKHWVLYPPEQKPFYDPDFTSRHWMEEVYTSLLEQEVGQQQDRKPYECTLFPGDMIYFPDKWYHATINLDRYTVFVSTFTTEHNVL
jgi:hypothetical protein